MTTTTSRPDDDERAPGAGQQPRHEDGPYDDGLAPLTYPQAWDQSEGDDDPAGSTGDVPDAREAHDAREAPRDARAVPDTDGDVGAARDEPVERGG